MLANQNGFANALRKLRTCCGNSLQMESQQSFTDEFLCGDLLRYPSCGVRDEKGSHPGKSGTLFGHALSPCWCVCLPVPFDF